MRLLEGHILNAINGERLYPFGGLEQDEVALFGKPLARVRRIGCRLLLRAARRHAEDRGGITVRAEFGDDGLSADVRFQEFAHAQRRALHQHALRAGDHAGELGPLFRRIRPERPDDWRGQIVHQDIAMPIGRHLALVRHKGMPILEHRDFLYRQFAESA